MLQTGSGITCKYFPSLERIAIDKIIKPLHHLRLVGQVRHHLSTVRRFGHVLTFEIRPEASILVEI
jgi:hypothetical protein